MTDTYAIQRLHEHRRWVNAQWLQAIEPIAMHRLRQRFEIGMGSVWDTVVHLYAAEYIWLAAIEGDPDPPAPGTFALDDLPTLRDAWAALDARWVSFLDGLADEDLTRLVSKRSTSSMKGRAVGVPLMDILLHVCTHAQYTTAQGVNMLRHLGVSPLPDSMLITLSRQQRGPQ